MDRVSNRHSLSQIFIFFIICIVLNMSSNIVSSYQNIDSNADIFHYVGINKEVQIKHQYCNFKCVVSPFYHISMVQIQIFFPNGTSVQYPMQYVNEGFYAYSIIFEKVGSYAFQIIASLYDSESYESGIHSFWIANSYDDKDSDGIDDWWEKKYGLDPTNAYDASLDPDGDGYTNKEEFIRNTNPLRNNVFENAWNKLSDNSYYFFISFLFLLVLSWISLYGIKKVHS